MPGPGPSFPAALQPVEFDLAAATEAAELLEAAARRVDAAGHARARDLLAAEREWSGGQRQLHDRSERALDHLASEIVARLRAQARHIRDVVADVATDDRRRSHRRTDLQREWDERNGRELQAARYGRPT